MNISKKQYCCMVLAVMCALLQKLGASPVPSFVCEDDTAIYYYYKDADKISFDGYPINEDLWIPKVASSVHGGARFSNKRVTVDIGSQGASILTKDKQVFACRPPLQDLNAKGISRAGLLLGSIIRSGPSTEAAKLTALPIGTIVSLEERSNKTLNGYHWFKITYGAKRKIGYVWGGTLCFDGKGEAGSFHPCPLGVLP